MLSGDVCDGKIWKERPTTTWMDCSAIDCIIRNINNWKQQSKNCANWKKLISSLTKTVWEKGTKTKLKLIPH